MSAMAQGNDGFGDIADSATDAFDDAADEGAAIADGAVDDAAAIAADAEGDAVDAAKDGAEAAKGAAAETDGATGEGWEYWSSPKLWIGIINCFDFVWMFIWGYFVYIPTNSSDTTVADYHDGSAGVSHNELPIEWFWKSVANPTVGWTALGYLFIWLFYLIISVPGTIFFIWAMVEDAAAACEGTSGNWLFVFWSKWFGLYGSWVLYVIPPIMFIVQMAQINGDIYAGAWINAIVLTSMTVLSWVATGVIHVLFVPALKREFKDACAPKEAAPVAEVPAETIEVPESIDEEPTVDEGNDWD